MLERCEALVWHRLIDLILYRKPIPNLMQAVI